MATITARYQGTCAVCGEQIAPGQQMDYERGRQWQRHAACPAPAIPEGAIPVSMGEGYGGTPYTVGRAFRNRNAYSTATPEGQPDYLVPLLAGADYYRDDGMSFGVGDERGHVYWALCRPATDAEAAPLRDAAERAQRRRDARKTLEGLARRIGREGEYPDKGTFARPAGETIALDRSPDARIYGGGEALVLDEAGGHIWRLLGNGADGDDWGRNNLPSTVATRIPWDDDLAAELRAAAATRAEETADA